MAAVARPLMILPRTAAVVWVLLNAGFLSGCWLAGEPSPQVVNASHAAFPSGALTVVTFNMLHGFGNRVNDETLTERLLLLRDGILSAAPDVVILQEASLTPGRHGNVVDTLRDLLNRDPRAARPYNSAWVMGNGAAIIGFFEGSAILSHFEILSAESIAYRAQALLPPERRIALKVQIRTNGGGLTVIGTHLTNTDARRRRTLVRTLQARQLAAWTGRTGLTIIGGDFNSTPGTPPILAMIEAGAGDAWAGAVAGGSAAGLGLTALNGTVTDPKDAAEERIDYLFLFGPGAVVESARPFLDHWFPRNGGGVLWASDHIGVLARVRVP